jgi:hypothetical protein
MAVSAKASARTLPIGVRALARGKPAAPDAEHREGLAYAMSIRS